MKRRVALADDQALVRHGLASLLREIGEFDLVHECEDGEQLLAALSREPVDVIVSDVRMPRVDGIAVLESLRRRGDRTPVVLLTTFDDPSVFTRACAAGASGFLLKDASPDELRDTIHAAIAGERRLQPLSPAPVKRHLGARDAAAANPLTAREIAILRLVAGGYSNKQIGQSLFLAEGTVKNYVSEILVKLDSRDRTHAVLRAITMGLI